MQLSYLSHVEIGQAVVLKTGWLFAHHAHLVVDDGQGIATWAGLQATRRGLGGRVSLAAEGLVRGSEVVMRNDRLFVGQAKRAIANTVCITASLLIER